jgi:hypothetical protein
MRCHMSLLHWNLGLTCVIFWRCREKKLKIGIAGSNRCITTAGSTNSIVGGVSDRVVNLDVDAHDIDRGLSILDSRSGILFLR